MIIYRIQDTNCENGEGPYFSNIKFNISHKASKHRPSPLHEEFIYSTEKFREYKFGFPNITKLKQWFKEDLNTLLEKGYYIVRMEIKEGQLGKSKKQVLFHKNSIIKVKDITQKLN